MTATIQTAIPTLDRTVMHDLLTTQFYHYGIDPTIYTTVYKGVPLYLITCNNGIQYVCTRAQTQYIVMRMANKYNIVFTFTPCSTAFRVYPNIKNLQHNLKGAQYGVVYTSISKAQGFSGCLAI